MDHLTGCIYQLSHDLSDICGALWGKYIKILHLQLQKRIRDYIQGHMTYCWPSIGNILFFQLLGRVFSTSDYRHILVEATYYYITQCLTTCPVNNISDIYSGILCISILVEMTVESKRYIPEVCTFLGSIFGLYLNGCGEGRGSERGSEGRSVAVVTIQKTFNLSRWNTLREIASTYNVNSSGEGEVIGKIKWSWLGRVDSATLPTPTSPTPLQACTILSCAQTLTTTILSRYQDHAAYPELVTTTGILGNLQALRPHDVPKLPHTLLLTHTILLENITKNSINIRHTRIPLQWRIPHKPTITTKTPRFDLDYNYNKKGHNSDLSSENRMKLKQLTKEKKRETKAVIRELRRDSDYLEQAKYIEKTAQATARQEERYKNYSWLAEQQATLNEHVRKGGELLRGGGSGGIKKVAKRSKRERR